MHHGKLALITGASQGLGARVAGRLAAEGCRVAVNHFDDSPDKARRVAEAIVRAGGEAFVCRCDVSDEAAVARMFAELERDHGGVAVLVNNARVDPLSRGADESDGAWWDRVTGVGLKGAYLCCQAFFRHATARGWGRIVNVSSCRAHRANELEAVAYATAKLGMHCLTRCYAQAGAPHGITVNTLVPGMIATENMMRRIGQDGYEAECARIALRRAGTCDEIADGVVWALKNAFMTGESININGGQHYAP